MARSRLTSIFVSLLISSLAVVYLGLHSDWQAVRAAAQNVQLGYIPVIVSVYMLSHLWRGLRWKKMLAPIQNVSLRASTEIVLMGYMANNLLPLRLGEFVRAFTLSRSERISKITALSSIGIERVLDGLMLLGCLVLAALGTTLEPELARRFAIIGGGAAGLFCLSFLGVLAVRVFPQPIRACVKFFTRRWNAKLGERLAKTLESVIESLAFVRWDINFIGIVLLTACVWLTEAAVFWLGLHAFAITPTWTLALFTLAIVNLSILIPSAPGYVGIFQMGTVIAFTALGQSPELATAYAMLIHLCQYLPVTLLGIAIMNWRGYKLKELARPSEAHGETVQNSASQTANPFPQPVWENVA